MKSEFNNQILRPVMLKHGFKESDCDNEKLTKEILNIAYEMVADAEDENTQLTPAIHAATKLAANHLAKFKNFATKTLDELQPYLNDTTKAQ